MNTRQQNSTADNVKTGENDSDTRSHTNKVNERRFLSSNFRQSGNNIGEAKPIFTSMVTDRQTDESILHRDLDKRLDKPFSYSTVHDEPKPTYNDVPVPESWFVVHILRPPEGYRMTLTTFVVSLTDETTEKTIANHIFASNKMRSVHAEYCNEDAIAKCKTRSFMKFHIRLFKTSERTVSVEVQRRSGCCLAFKEEYQALLQVFKGDSIPQLPMRKKLDLANLKCLEKDLIPIPEGAIEESLELSLKYLSSDMYDAKLLALEDLIASTDTESDIAPKACHLILNNYIDILMIVLELICKFDNIDDEDDDSFERDHCLALTLLRNISIKSSTEEKFISLTSKDTLLHSLLRDINMAANFPWNACLATKCLSIICVNSTEALEKVTKCAESVRWALENAKVIGEKCFHSLEVEAKQALQIMKTL